MNAELLWEEIKREMKRQDEQFGDQSGHSNELWLAILTEEVGEVAKSILKRKPIWEIREELIQVAAVAINWLIHS